MIVGMSFEPGRVLCLKVFVGGHLNVAVPARVVEHNADWLMLWVAGNSPVWQVDLPAGVHLRDTAPEDRPINGFPLTTGTFHSGGALLLQPAGASHAVWWLFTPEMEFRSWYVNLEHRAVRGEDIEVVDHELDLLVASDRTWEWKDEQSFADKTGHYAFWTEEEATAIRAGGQQVGLLAETGEFPFDGSWCEFTPPPSWDLPELPGRPTALLANHDAA